MILKLFLNFFKSWIRHFKFKLYELGLCSGIIHWGFKAEEFSSLTTWTCHNHYLASKSSIINMALSNAFLNLVAKQTKEHNSILKSIYLFYKNKKASTLKKKNWQTGTDRCIRWPNILLYTCTLILKFYLIFYFFLGGTLMNIEGLNLINYKKAFKMEHCNPCVDH